MSSTSINLSGLINPKQVEQLFSSIFEIGAQLLLVTDLKGLVLAKVAHPTIPAEITQHFYSGSYKNGGEAIGLPYQESRIPIEIQSQKIGYVIGIAFDVDSETARRLAATTQFAGHVLSEQVYKEYELTSLTTELLSRYEELTLLYEMSQTLGSVFDVQTICDIALEMAMQVLPAERAFIALKDDNSEDLTVIASQGVKGFVGWKVPIGQGITGYVASTGEQVLLDAQELPSGQTTAPLKTPKKGQNPTEATLAVPLMLSVDYFREEKGILGVMTMAGKPPGEQFSAGNAKLLTTLAAQVTTAIHNSRLVRALREAERVQQQIKIAAQIQQSLLPKQSPQVPGITLAARCVSAANVGGDYYDFLTDDHDRLTLLIADASGHSVGSALMMVTARSRLRYEIALGKSLSTILADTNEAIFDDLSQAEMFISMFCARYEPATRQLTFSNAGHNPPLLHRASNNEILNLEADGLILGVLDQVEFEEKSVVLEPGDVLVLYTDGVIEARAPAGQMFGLEQFQSILTKYNSLPPDKLIDQIYKTISLYTDNAAQQDDITLLILKVT